MALKAGVTVTSCDVAVATKLNHTSNAFCDGTPQLLPGGRLWVAPSPVPLVGLTQSAVTGTATAAAQSLLAGATASVAKVSVAGALPAPPVQLAVTATV